MEVEKMVLVMFTKDTMIIPKETAWFEHYYNTDIVEKLEYSVFYKEDFIGIRYLNEAGRINFAEIEGDHLQFSYEDLDEIVVPALI